MVEPEEIDVSWCEEEFAGANFKDQRLNKRLVKSSQRFSKQPLASINQAQEDWAASKAAYRFFDNEKVSQAGILAPHIERTKQRLAGYEFVLAVQDTTELDYSRHPHKEGLGPIGNHQNNALGLLLHSSLVFTTQGLPLGLLSQQIWSREAQADVEKPDKKQVCIAEKESYKWLQGLEESVEHLPEGVNLVQLCDRESDVFEFLLRAEQLSAHYVIRAAQDRRLDAEISCLWEKLSQQKVAGRIEVEVSSQQNRARRTALCEVRYAEVIIKPPQRRKELRPDGWKSLKVWAVWVKESLCPKAAEALEWMLLTNLEVTNFEDAVQRINWYRVRFQIEVYHKVLKSGCQVEESRLMSVERLKKHIVLLSIIAWRLYWMTFLNRTDPDAPCTRILAEPEWQALYCRMHKSQELPEELPRVREVVRWIAKLGGFLGRKSDKEPGVTTIWRGWQRLTDIVEDWLIFRRL